MVARPSGILIRHRGFQDIDLLNPVFTVENSEREICVILKDFRVSAKR